MSVLRDGLPGFGSWRDQEIPLSELQLTAGTSSCPETDLGACGYATTCIALTSKYVYSGLRAERLPTSTSSIRNKCLAAAPYCALQACFADWMLCMTSCYVCVLVETIWMTAAAAAAAQRWRYGVGSDVITVKVETMAPYSFLCLLSHNSEHPLSFVSSKYTFFYVRFGVISLEKWGHWYVAGLRTVRCTTVTI